MEQPVPINHQNDNYQNDEIDLVELFKGLWQERVTIVICTIVIGLIAGLYAFTAKPVYTASVELLLPNESALNSIKPITPKAQTDAFLYSPDAPLRQQQELINLVQRGNNNTTTEYRSFSSEYVFSLFLTTLESTNHIKQLIDDQSSLLTTELQLDFISDDLISNIRKIRTIEYPNTQKKNNALQPNMYALTYEGIDREALRTFIISDIKIAADTTNHLINTYYMEQLKQVSASNEKQKRIELASLDERIAARQWFLQATHKSNIAQLQEELSIAQATENNDAIIELTARLQTLQQRNNDLFYDEDLLSMQAQKRIINSDVFSNQINSEIIRIDNTPLTLNFFSDVVVSPTNPIKPKKRFILVIGLFLGGILGFMIALGRYVYKTYQVKNNEQ